MDTQFRNWVVKSGERVHRQRTRDVIRESRWVDSKTKILQNSTHHDILAGSTKMISREQTVQGGGSVFRDKTRTTRGRQPIGPRDSVRRAISISISISISLLDCLSLTSNLNSSCWMTAMSWTRWFCYQSGFFIGWTFLDSIKRYGNIIIIILFYDIVHK